MIYFKSYQIIILSDGMYLPALQEACLSAIDKEMAISCSDSSYPLRWGYTPEIRELEENGQL